MEAEKIKTLSTFYSLRDNQQKAIMMLFTSNMTQTQVAEELQIKTSTISMWKRQEKFRVAQDEYNRFMLRDMVSEAVITMRGLLHAKSEMVRFNAAKDIIDRADGNQSLVIEQARKVKAEADITEYKAKVMTDATNLEDKTVIVSDLPDEDN